MRPKRLLFTSLAFSAAAATSIPAQSAAGFPTIGTRLKVWTRGDRPTQFVGGLVQVTGESLTVRESSGVMQTIALADADRVKMYRGTVRHKDLGGVLGFVAGAIVGGVIGTNGASIPPECQEDVCAAFPSRAEQALDAAMTGGFVGICVGALIGHSIETDRWAEIGVSSLKPTVSVRPVSNRGAMLSLSVRF